MHVNVMQRHIDVHIRLSEFMTECARHEHGCIWNMR